MTLTSRQRGEPHTPPCVRELRSFFSRNYSQYCFFRSHIRRINRSMGKVRVIIEHRFVATLLESAHGNGSR